MAVVRVRVSQYARSISEHWTSESEAEIRELFVKEERNYPTQGYGTSITIRPDPTGLLWHGDFYRFTSCD